CSTSLREASALTGAPRRAGGTSECLVRREQGARKEKSMLRIYPVSLEMVRDVREFADAIQRFDGDLARQLRRASMSVVLNLSEGSGSRGGRRRMRYED